MPVVAAVCLLAFDRFGINQRFEQFFAARLMAEGWSANEVTLAGQAWLTASCVILFTAIPSAYLVLFRSDQTWGLGIGQAARNWRLYGGIAAGMLVLVWIASGLGSFRHFYPMYDPPTARMWLTFELIYLTQFFCVEFFFRGPMLFRLEQRFGLAAIGVMVVPYALIHIYKPIPEALGSIGAGFVLGYLALKARSIWPGVFLHVTVAFSMDLFALARSGRLTALLFE
jgi:membrane protease YdiL (CAAX protease family)